MRNMETHTYNVDTFVYVSVCGMYVCAVHTTHRLLMKTLIIFAR